MLLVFFFHCVCVCVCVCVGPDDSALPDDGVRVSVKKKKVSWASEDNLTSVHYFELDESERGKHMYSLLGQVQSIGRLEGPRN